MKFNRIILNDSLDLSLVVFAFMKICLQKKFINFIQMED